MSRSNDNKWHHLVVTWKSVGGAIRVYKDGVLAYKNAIPLQAGASITTGGTLVLGQEQDRVGGGFDPTQAFLGKMDEFALYRSVLTAAQAKAHYDAGTTAPTCASAAHPKSAAVRAAASNRPRRVPGSEFLPSLPKSSSPVGPVGPVGRVEQVSAVNAVTASLAADQRSVFCPLLGV